MCDITLLKSLCVLSFRLRPLLTMWSVRPRPLLLLFLLLIQSVEPSVAVNNHTEPLQEVILAAILPLTNTNYPWAWPRVAPVLYRAVEQVNSDPWLLQGLNLTLVHGSSEDRKGLCSDYMAPLVAVDLKMALNPWAFIGPGCVYSASPVARFTTHWQVPMVTAGACAMGFADHNSVTNVGPTHQKLGELGLAIQDEFGWQHAMLIFSMFNGDRQCYFAAEGLFTVLDKNNISAREYVMLDDFTYRGVAQELQDHGRGQRSTLSHFLSLFLH